MENRISEKNNLLKLNNETTQPSKFITLNCVEINAHHAHVEGIFKFKSRFTNNTSTDGNVNVEITTSFLDKFWRAIEIQPINCEMILDLNWSANCDKCEVKSITTFSKTETKIYVSVVTLSAQDNTNLFQQLKIGFKRTINWNKRQSGVPKQAKY